MLNLFFNLSWFPCEPKRRWKKKHLNDWINPSFILWFYFTYCSFAVHVEIHFIFIVNAHLFFIKYSLENWQREMHNLNTNGLESTVHLKLKTIYARDCGTTHTFAVAYSILIDFIYKWNFALFSHFTLQNRESKTEQQLESEIACRNIYHYFRSFACKWPVLRMIWNIKAFAMEIVSTNIA